MAEGERAPLPASCRRFNPFQSRERCDEPLTGRDGTGNLNNWVIGH